MNAVAGQIRTGEYVAADGDHMTGRIEGDHWFGFWAYTLNGDHVGCYATLDAAAEVLALEYTLRRGQVQA